MVPSIEDAKQYLVAHHARHGETITIKSAQHGEEHGEPLTLVTFQVDGAAADYVAGIWCLPNGQLYGEW